MPSGAIDVLRQQAQSPGHLLGVQGRDVLAIENHLAAGRFDQPGQPSQQGGLATRVGADDRGDLSVGHLHRQAGDDGVVLVADRQMAGM